MADQVFNIALGRVAELYNRVDLNDPAAAELSIAVLATTGIETDAVLKDKEDFAAVVSGTTNEVTNTNYVKIALTDTDLVAFAADHSNDRVDLDIPDQTWTAVAAGDGWNDLLIMYDDDGLETAANLVPMTMHDFVATPDGSDITAQINAAGFYRAS